MKIVFNLIKLLTGALFVFSGLVKLNDPAGFSIKLNEYFDVFAEDVSPSQDSVQLQILSENTICFDDKFVLYPSDSEKEVKFDFSADTLGNYSIQFKWGGIERSTAFQSEQSFPKKIGLRFIPLAESGNNSTTGPNTQYFQLDSTDVIQKKAQINYTYDVTRLVKPTGFLSGFFKSCKSYSLHFSVFFCALEVLLGLAMLIGYEIKVTVIITALLIGFFTFLTGYSAYFNKVTDCGCFGDFLKLEPWTSFKKDLILSFAVFMLIIGWKHNKSLFVRGKAHLVMGILSVLTFGFGIYCYLYLPIWDFLPYKKGNDIKFIMENIPEGERATDSIQVRFVMQKGNDSVKVTTLEYAKYAEKGYTFVRQDRQTIIEGYKSPIHDFAIYNLATGEDLKDRFLQSSNYQMVYIMPFLSEANTSSLTEIKTLYELGKKQGWDFYALSSASLAPSNEFIKKHQLPFEMYAADQKMLMTMARYNPTLYIFKGSRVLEKYSGNNLPVFSELLALTEGIILNED